ncbi:MAG: phosphate transport system regulatory protein PhoU [Candidatus Zixiibacteriota bacterium]|nr:MAG: phosphate transport system regulatory protein PhoU [candidate division Zixibacteria bacterium]
MTQHFQREIEKLKRKLLELSAVVEESVANAVKAVLNHDAALAQTVIASDNDIDNREVELEEDCLKILALHQPVAIDLRFIVAVLKINNDLERIGDLAVNIAERLLVLHTTESVDVPGRIQKMTALVQQMLKASLDALVNLDADTAQSVRQGDDEVDRLNREVFERLKERMADDPTSIDECLQLLGVSRHLERIADHTTNIAEDILYMIDGRIVRHYGGDREETPAAG